MQFHAKKDFTQRRKGRKAMLETVGKSIFGPEQMISAAKNYENTPLRSLRLCVKMHWSYIA